MSIFTATMAFLATPAFGAAVGNDIAARSAELDAREAQVEARAALLVCQFGGVEACSVEVRLPLCPLPFSLSGFSLTFPFASASLKGMFMADTAAPPSKTTAAIHFQNIITLPLPTFGNSGLTDTTHSHRTCVCNHGSLVRRTPQVRTEPPAAHPTTIR